MTREKQAEKTPVSPMMRVIPTAFLTYGAIDIVILTISGFRIVYLFVLGALSFAGFAGLWMRRRWGVWLAALAAFLNVSVGITTLVALVGFQGVSSNNNTLLLQLSLVGYTFVAIILLLYVLAKRSLFLLEEKTP